MRDPEEESLAEWAARRRRRPEGERRTLVLGEGPRGAHTNPTAPRLLMTWDGYAWQPTGVAADLDHARRFTGTPSAPSVRLPGSYYQQEGPALTDGKGRRRRT